MERVHVPGRDPHDSPPARPRPASSRGCNGLDDDCDPSTLEDATGPLWYADADGDGHGDPASTTASCEPPDGYVSAPGDCSDGDPDVGLAPTWFADDDGDGFGDPDRPVVACVAPPDNVPDATDCDDADADVFPGAPEVCNAGTDDDCDPSTDEAVVAAVAWFPDLDRDGFGEDLGGGWGCADVAGRTELGGDCDDRDGAVHPGAAELCNGGVDDDCDPATDEGALGTPWFSDDDGDGYGDPGAPFLACGVAPEGASEDGSDCDDNDADVYPGAPEWCDGLDQDCDLVADDAPEQRWYPDVDGDGFGDALAGVPGCAPVADHVDVGGDCADGDPLRYPGAPELCDAIDQDCDPTTPDDPCGSGCLWISGGGTYKTATGAKLDDHPTCAFDAFGPDGLLYETLGDAVYRHDSVDCAFLGRFTSLDASEYGDDPGVDEQADFGQPVWDDAGDLFVPWTHEFLYRAAVDQFDGATGVWVRSVVPLFGTESTAIGGPRGRVDAHGRLVLAAGEVLLRVDPATGGIEEFPLAHDDAVDLALGPDDTAFVLEFSSGDVSRYDLLTGAYLGEVTRAGGVGFSNVEDLIVSAEGELLVLDGAEVVRFDMTFGQELGSFPIDLSGQVELGPCPEWFVMSLLPGGPLTAGLPVVLEVVDAAPGATVTFEYSEAGTGAGACPADLGGLCSDLLSPAQLGTSVADLEGRASLEWLVPADAPLGELAFQAFVYGGAAPTKSNATLRPVEAPALPLDCEVEVIAAVSEASIQLGDVVTLSALLRGSWGPTDVELEDGCVPPVSFTGLPDGWDPWDGCALPTCTSGTTLVPLDDVAVEVATVDLDTSGSACNGPWAPGEYTIGVAPSWVGPAPVTCGEGTTALTVRYDRLLADAHATFRHADGFRDGAVAMPGDVDGNGLADVLIGGWDGDARLMLAPFGGTIELADADLTFNGFVDGPTVSAAGDVDGDGYRDLLLGDPGAYTFTGTGRAFVVRGPLAPGLLDMFALPATFAARDDDGIGADLAALGDTNGDGLDDVVAAGDSMVVLVAGPADGTFDASTATAAILADGPPDVAGPGDVDGDGLADLLIAAEGEVHLLHGPLSGAMLARSSDATVVGAVDEDDLGYIVEGAGDHDGDGLADLWISRSNGDDPGTVALVPGNVTGTTDVDAVSLATLSNSDVPAISSLADAGDLDGDGFRDVVVGTRNESYGAAWLLYGPFSGSVLTVESGVRYVADDTTSGAGNVVAGGTDVDGDGLSDVLVGAAGAALNQPEYVYGHAWLLLGGPRPW